MVKYVYDAWGNHLVLDANGQPIPIAVTAVGAVLFAPYVAAAVTAAGTAGATVAAGIIGITVLTKLLKFAV